MERKLRYLPDYPNGGVRNTNLTEDQMTPDEIIEKAMQSLEEDGWCQGAYQNEEGEHCTLGALAHAQTGEGRYYKFFEGSNAEWKTLQEAAERVARQLFAVTGITPSSAYLKARTGTWSVIPYANDNPNTTKEDVLLSMKRALHADE